MGIIWTFEHPGQNGGTWYAAQYPLGATRYYATPQAREDAMSAYVRAIEATGGTAKVLAA